MENKKIGLALAVVLIAIGVSFALHGVGPRLGVLAVGLVAFVYAIRANRRIKKGVRR